MKKRRNIALIFALFFACLQPSSGAESPPDTLTAKPKEETGAESPPDTLTAKPKEEKGRVRGAVLRSVVLPGWGQFYNGKHVKGSVIATAEVASAIAWVVRREQIKDRGIQARNIYLFSTIGIVLYSIADAYVDAHLSRVDWAEIEAGVDENGAAKLRLKVAF